MTFFFKLNAATKMDPSALLSHLLKEIKLIKQDDRPPPAYFPPSFCKEGF